MSAVITDPPYSSRTVKGQRSAGAEGPKAKIAYAPLSVGEQLEVVEAVDRVCDRFAVIFGDHEQMAVYDSAFGAKPHWLRFAPVAWVKQGAAPRMCGDGPSPHTEWIYVARRRGAVTKRFRPGYYLARQVRGAPLVGAKPVDLMRALVRDYSEPGETVLDLFAGTGSTLVACREEGRNAIGAEADTRTYSAAMARIGGLDVQA